MIFYVRQRRKPVIRWSSKMPRGTHHSEQGNIFAIILVAVILFAALIFVFSTGLNTGSTKIMTAEGRTMAADVIDYGARIERALQLRLQSGISESDISFESTVVPGYDHTPAANDAEKIFGTGAGSGLTPRLPLPGQSPATTNRWLFTGDMIITGQEDDTKSELLALLPVSQELCTEINRQLNLSIDLSAAASTFSVTKFTGTFLDDITLIITPGTGITAGCVRHAMNDGVNTGSYNFFRVLIAR